jgi:Mn-dependent DtxR family transcriptional regulator
MDIGANKEEIRRILMGITEFSVNGGGASLEELSAYLGEDPDYLETMLAALTEEGLIKKEMVGLDTKTPVL